MSWATINNVAVIAARLYVPRVGAWSADVVVDTASATQLPDGTAASFALASGGIPWQGTVLRSDPYSGKVKLRLVGGANGLGLDAKPRFYAGVNIGKPLADVLVDAGETLSADSMPSVTGFDLNFWTTIVMPVGKVLTNLMDAGPANSIWRVLNDGAIWVGVDGFAPSTLTDYELLEYQAQDGSQLIAAEFPNVFPGQSFEGQSVSTVEHTVTAKGNSTKLWFE
jgi:hypothetical protein